MSTILIICLIIILIHGPTVLVRMKEKGFDLSTIIAVACWWLGLMFFMISTKGA